MQYLNFPPNTKLVGMGTALLQNLIYFACIEKDSYRSSIVVNWLLSSTPFFSFVLFIVANRLPFVRMRQTKRQTRNRKLLINIAS